MKLSGFFYFPLAFVLLALFVFVLIELHVIGYAYERIGIAHQYAFLVLLLSLVGSCINIPIVELPAEQVLSGREVIYFGMRYVGPVLED